VKNKRLAAIIPRSLVACLLIAGVLAGSLAVITLRDPVDAALTTDTAPQTEAGHAYLFHDPINGTELYVSTGSGVYRFTSPDGYDTGTVRAAQMHITPDVVIQINDFSRGFNFNCNINFKANWCSGNLHDRQGGDQGGHYHICAPTAGAEIVENAVIPATTVVLGETTLEHLSLVSEDYTLTFDELTRQLESLSPGDVIASGVSEITPCGLLRQVVNVISDGNQMTVETVAATLEDAIQECNVAGSWSLLPDGSTVPLGMMVSETYQSCTFSSDANVQLDSMGGTKSMASIGSCTGWYIDIDDVVLFDADGNLGTKDDQIIASGSLCADIQFDFGLTIDDWAVEEAHFSVTTTETAELQVELKVTIAEFHEKIELYRQYLNPIVMWVGCVPVVIAPVVTLNVGVDAEASAGITISITEIADVTVGVTYEADTWSPVTDFSTSFGWEPPTLTAGCKVKGYVGPQLALLLYGVTGPYGETRGYLELEADLFDTPWWRLYGGVEADVGFRVEVLGHNIADYEVPAAIGYRVLLAQAETPTPVNFPDPNLEAVVREAIGKATGPIYPSDLEGLTSLHADQRNISELTGLEHCTSLTDLYLWVNQISDISPLAGLTSLQLLWLNGNQISDISPLANLTSLTDLSLGGNQISDISPLANLTSLTGLDLEGNQISDISPLANLTSLTGLDLEGNQISDISPLANLTSLTSLDLRNNQISDVSHLANLTKLTYLDLCSNQISDIAPLANLTSLTWLDLEWNQISDISPLANLTSLTSLSLGGNQISDVSPLANLTSLTWLDLEWNQISDISPLYNLTNLTWLRLAGNQISDISPLANLTSLTGLALRDNQISDISPLVQNEGLGTGDRVYLSGNPLNSDSINIYIPQLEARGVIVDY